MAPRRKRSEFNRLRNAVGLGRQDLAENFLEISKRTLQRWDKDGAPTWAMRLLRYHDRIHCTAHGQEWAGFMFSRGRLVNAREHLTFTPDRLRLWPAHLRATRPARGRGGEPEGMPDHGSRPKNGKISPHNPPGETDMADNVENLVLEHLRALRAGQDRIEHKLSELSSRITSLETAMTRSRSENLSTQEDVYRQQSILDRINERLERVERRLEII